MDFLSHVLKRGYKEAILVSFGVISFYTNNAHNLEGEAVEFWIYKHSQGIQESFSREFILEGLHLVQETSYSFFDNQYTSKYMGA